MLRELGGIVVREAASADEALASLAADPVEIVVLDVHMPGRSGLDVLPELKAHHARPVVLMVTSHPTEQLRRQALAMGADLFLDKSREFDRVLQLVAVRRG